MAEAAFLDRHYFLLRRLHSLSGVFPIGAFLVPHLTTNSSIVWGRWLNPSHLSTGQADALAAAGYAADTGVETFLHEVNFLHALPALVLIEIGLLWLPIAFHALLGLVFAQTGRVNIGRYSYQDNWRYTWQRVTGYVGIVFIFMHVTSLRFGWTYWGLMPAFEYAHAASTTGLHFQEGVLGIPFAAAFYLVGVLALVYHFANGLWTAAITWGLTISVASQRRWGYVCGAVGLFLAAAAVVAVAGFASLDVDQAAEIERLLAEGH
ncbi:MAG: succinate dehydrogenase/fumarate reductase transmembrane subunit [Planctomycetota bacterium]